jgi:hypothetical protein
VGSLKERRTKRVNLSTLKPDQHLELALKNIHRDFRKRIIASYLEIRRRHVQAIYDDKTFDAIGISAGKFCESVLRLLQQELTGSYIPFGNHIRNFVEECRALEKLQKSSGLEALRIIIPRSLMFIYTIRGKRGIGHVGGDIDANIVDINTITTVSNWIICELIRIYHGLSLEEAQSIIETLISRRIPLIWEVMGKKRVLRNDLTYKQKTLLLAYTTPDEGILVEDLFSWSEYSNFYDYKKHVLKPLHKDKLIEYDEDTGSIIISPLGIKEVENKILSPET